MSLPSIPKVAGWHAFTRALSIGCNISGSDGNEKEILDICESIVASHRRVLGGRFGLGSVVEAFAVGAAPRKGTESPDANMATAA